MRYSIYQIQINPNAFDASDPSMKAKIDALMLGDPTSGLTGNFYAKVAEIEAADLDEVFDIGNIGPEHKITRIGRMHSMSVGDIIEDADGIRSVVASFGFNPV